MVVLLGKTCAGKTQLKEELIKLGYSRVTSWTTRKMRPGERVGFDYNYCTDEEFKKLKDVGFFAETTSYKIADGSTVYYGTPIEELTENAVAIFNPEGFKNLQKLTTLNYVSFYIATPEEILRKRLKFRGDNELEINRRLEADNYDFQRMEEKADYTIKNDGTISLVDIAHIISGLEHTRSVINKYRTKGELR